MGAARSPEETPLTGSKWNLQLFRTDNDDTRISLTRSSLVNANEIQYASAATRVQVIWSFLRKRAKRAEGTPLIGLRVSPFNRTTKPKQAILMR